MHPSCNYSVPSYSKQSLENVTLLQKVVNSSHLAALVIAQCTLIALALNAHLWHSWVVNAVADSTYWSDADKVQYMSTTMWNGLRYRARAQCRPRLSLKMLTGVRRSVSTSPICCALHPPYCLGLLYTVLELGFPPKLSL